MGGPGTRTAMQSTEAERAWHPRTLPLRRCERVPRPALQCDHPLPPAAAAGRSRQTQEAAHVIREGPICLPCEMRRRTY